MANSSPAIPGSPLPLQVAAPRVYIFRGREVMLDFDVAALYEAPVFRLNQAVRRHPERFPPDFMFQLTPQEAVALAHFSAAAGRHGRYPLPLAFTELGVAMLAGVLSTGRAIEISIVIAREFARAAGLRALAFSAPSRLSA